MACMQDGGCGASVQRSFVRTEEASRMTSAYVGLARHCEDTIPGQDSEIWVVTVAYAMLNLTNSSIGLGLSILKPEGAHAHLTLGCNGLGGPAYSGSKSQSMKSVPVSARKLLANAVRYQGRILYPGQHFRHRSA